MIVIAFNGNRSDNIKTEIMKNNHEHYDEPPNKRISWSIYALSMCITGLLCGLTIVSFPVHKTHAFWISFGIGSSVAPIVNLLRPKYENTGRFWKPIYEFLLKQMPPPD
jgi:hypothetical protein